uniref:Uncharacterized protein n=1 Tax=Oryza glumipatula TaxID=40148 RepID=A0A0E0BFN0_9ORYZ
MDGRRGRRWFDGGEHGGWISRRSLGFSSEAAGFSVRSGQSPPRPPLSTEMNGSFLGATIYGELLRANPNTQFWNRILLFLRELARKQLTSSGLHPEDLFERNIPLDMSRLAVVDGQVQCCLVYDLRVAGPAEGELPKLTSRDMLLGGDIPVEDKFDVLVWRSRIPPYCNYIVTALVSMEILISAVATLARPLRRGYDTIIALAAWSIWKEHNNIVFNQKVRSWTARGMAEETMLWRLANPASKRKSTQKSDGSVIDRRWCGEEEKMAGEEGGWWCELAAAAEATRFKNPGSLCKIPS